LAQSLSDSLVVDASGWAVRLASMAIFDPLLLLVFSFFQTVASQVFWEIGDAGLSCDAVCAGYDTTCEEQELKNLGGEMTSDYTACEPKFALAGYECGGGSPVNRCEPDNCRAWGSPYVHADSFLNGICNCGAGNLPSQCDSVPSDKNHRRLCPCAGEKPGGLCEEFTSCHCWGDPHCTLTFWNTPMEIHFMDLGLFKYGSNSDGSLEVQGWNCRFLRGATIKAFAVRAHGRKVTIFNNDVYLDDVPVTFDGSQPAWLTQDGQFTNVDAEDGCWHFTTEAVLWRTDYWHEFDLDIAKQQESSEGFCGSEDGRDRVGASDAIFTPAELDRLYALCPEAPQVTRLRSLSDAMQIMPSPMEVCSQAESVTYEDAVMMCEALIEKNQFYQSCIYDYCASDGAVELVENANKSAFSEAARSRLYRRGPVTNTTNPAVTATSTTATTTAAEDAARMSTLLGLPSLISLAVMQFYMYVSQ